MPVTTLNGGGRNGQYLKTGPLVAVIARTGNPTGFE